jgi:Leucine-rich repeat (LRR) protein
LYLGAGNQLTGTIPPALGQLSKLKILALDRNLLTGSIPVSFGNLDSIQTVFLYSNQFTGALPGEFLNLTKLVYLDIQRNQIDYIPELKNIPTLNHLDCSYNKLTFSDIEKNTGINEFYYSPQANIGEEQYYTLNIGENFVYSIVTGGTQNKYQWYKDGNILAKQSASTLEINILEPTDAGTYYCQVTSDLVPDLVISSQNINLSVTTDICYNVGLVGTFNQWGNDNSDLMMEQDAENSCFWSIIQKFDDDGEVKFRRDYDWNVSWGNTGFPYDTASLQGPNIPVPAGTYEITFNSGTGVYNFQAINVSCNLIDSLALVAIYNTTNGPGWSRNDNWLNGPVQTWYGVTMNSDGRVIGLNLVRNGLNGVIPSEIGNLAELRRLHLGNYEFLVNWYNWNNLNYQPLPASMANLTKIEILSLDDLRFNHEMPDIFGGMTALRELYIGDNYFTNETLPEGIGACYNLELLGIEYNNFSQIPDLTGCTKLQNFMAYGCYFSFEDIEPNLWIPEFNYLGQRLVLGAPESINPLSGETITRTIEVGGSNNIYQWLKDGEELAGQNTNTLTLENVSEADAGIYNLRVTNSMATQLTLGSHAIILYQSQLPGYDALVGLYNSTDGNNWYNNTNWLSDQPITTWFGITINPNGLMSLSLSSNNLVGTLPLEFGDLSIFYHIRIINPLCGLTRQGIF